MGLISFIRWKLRRPRETGNVLFDLGSYLGWRQRADVLNQFARSKKSGYNLDDERKLGTWIVETATFMHAAHTRSQDYQESVATILQGYAKAVMREVHADTRCAIGYKEFGARVTSATDVINRSPFDGNLAELAQLLCSHVYGNKDDELRVDVDSHVMRFFSSLLKKAALLDGLLKDQRVA